MKFSKKISFLLIALSSISFNLKADRVDSINYKIGIGYALFPGLANADAGLNAEFRIKKNIFLELGYYYRFYGARIVQSEAWYKYNPTHGYYLQSGLRFYRKSKKSEKLSFMEYRLGYKSIHIPNYTWIEGYGLDLVSKRNLTVYEQVFKAGFAIGKKQVHGNKFYMEESLSAGIEYRMIREHLFRSWGDISRVTYYPENTYRYKKLVLPYIEVSIRIGFGL